MVPVNVMDGNDFSPFESLQQNTLYFTVGENQQKVSFSYFCERSEQSFYVKKRALVKAYESTIFGTKFQMRHFW